MGVIPALDLPLPIAAFNRPGRAGDAGRRAFR